MIKIPSKHSPTHYMPLGAWSKHKLKSSWNSLPNAFINPYTSDKQFLFVCGCGHSGTTLMAAKLGQHSNTFLIGRETNAFSETLGSNCAKAIMREWDYFAEISGKKTIIEKTPKHIHSIRKIQNVSPTAKIVVMVRNPLDNIASLYSRFGIFEGAIRRWLADNKKALSQKNDSKIKLLRYEDLTSEPVFTLKDTCTFLDLAWEPLISESGETRYDEINQEGNMAIRSAQVRQPIKRNVGGWRQVLTKAQTDEVIRRTRLTAKQLGYRDLLQVE